MAEKRSFEHENGFRSVSTIPGGQVKEEGTTDGAREVATLMLKHLLTFKENDVPPTTFNWKEADSKQGPCFSVFAVELLCHCSPKVYGHRASNTRCLLELSYDEFCPMWHCRCFSGVTTLMSRCRQCYRTGAITLLFPSPCTLLSMALATS